jgi:hypothetical protein
MIIKTQIFMSMFDIKLMEHRKSSIFGYEYRIKYVATNKINCKLHIISFMQFFQQCQYKNG